MNRAHKGKTLEQKIIQTARKYKVRIIGPNTSGMINVLKNMNLVGVKDVPKGDIALLTQSGNIALHLITEASLKSHKGFSYYVGVGNEADIRFHEYLDFFTNDPDTKSILMYVEGLREAVASSFSRPILRLKKNLLSCLRAAEVKPAASLPGPIRDRWPVYPKWPGPLFRGPVSLRWKTRMNSFPWLKP